MEIDWSKWPENTDDLSKEEVIELIGGLDAVNKAFDDFREVTARLDKDRKALSRKYPHKWVVVGKDGLLSVEDSLEEVSKFTETNRVKHPHFAIEYLDPDPPVMIL